MPPPKPAFHVSRMRSRPETLPRNSVDVDHVRDLLEEDLICGRECGVSRKLRHRGPATLKPGAPGGLGSVRMHGHPAADAEGHGIMAAHLA